MYDLCTLIGNFHFKIREATKKVPFFSSPATTRGGGRCKGGLLKTLLDFIFVPNLK